MVVVRDEYLFVFSGLLGSFPGFSAEMGMEVEYYFFQQADTIPQDSLPYTPSKLPTYNPKDRFGDPFSTRLSRSPLLLANPNSLKLF